jgi:hypothetical protein
MFHSDPRDLRAWQDYLSAFEWTHFLHLTFAFEPTPESAEKALQGWRRRVTRVNDGSVEYFKTLTRGPVDGHWHLHLFTINTETLSCTQLKGAWRHGDARVETYDPGLGGVWYVLTQPGADDGEYDISEKLGQYDPRSLRSPTPQAKTESSIARERRDATDPGAAKDALPFVGGARKPRVESKLRIEVVEGELPLDVAQWAALYVREVLRLEGYSLPPEAASSANPFAEAGDT